MAQKKRKSKKQTSDTKITIIFVIVIIISVLALAGIWCYTHHPEVRAWLFQTFQRAEQFKEELASDGQQQEKVQHPSDDSLPAKDASDGGEDQSLLSTAVPPASDGLILLPSNLAFPRCPAVKHTPDHELRHFTDYDICYRESYEQAEWSAYQLERSELVKNASRSNDFRPDPQISTESASLADYRKSGYDRGHLAPAADFAYSPEAMSETFYMSNMTPQAPQFNRGIWKDLEEDVRSWANKYGRAYVICGPVLDENADRYATIGASKVVIPRYFYKIVLLPVYEGKDDFATPDDCTKLIARAYLIPNKQCDDSYEAYRVSINEIESRTGIDFFYLLDDSIEEKIESKASD
ncbi:MAG: DNA/RNA non-specific endonuclease [Treponema sp.]|nr:DNA/RNA non-specific endonuclease [Treponema sp.]